ncbi:MAG: bifunctional riboflavin kinase/FAD synthetase [Acidimicrobiales bacterium]
MRDTERPLDLEGEHAVTIGVYDGVHLGHQLVIRRTRELATERGLATALITFDPHPATVIRPESAPKLLTGLEHKLELVAAQGIDTTVVVPFDAERAAEPAAEFVDELIVGALKARVVVVGGNFHFGRGREGTTELLAELGEKYGFEVHALDLLEGANGGVQPVSSTAVRRALERSDVTAAAQMLGRPFEIRGPVTEGDRRGRTIGFPTANVAVPRPLALPADGVYAGWYVRPDGQRWPTAVNVGKRPTFYDNAEHSLVEAHLIGFDGDLYGEAARVELLHHLRPEQRFDGIDALAAQLQRDIITALKLLGVSH